MHFKSLCISMASFMADEVHPSFYQVKCFYCFLDETKNVIFGSAYRFFLFLRICDTSVVYRLNLLFSVPFLQLQETYFRTQEPYAEHF